MAVAAAVIAGMADASPEWRAGCDGSEQAENHEQRERGVSICSAVPWHASLAVHIHAMFPVRPPRGHVNVERVPRGGELTLPARYRTLPAPCHVDRQ